jgi:hypothetical protein
MSADESLGSRKSAVADWLFFGVKNPLKDCTTSGRVVVVFAL